jgi:hypothetical protein
MSELKIKGKIVKVLDAESGTSKAGKEWIKQTFVIDTEAQYNNEIAFGLFGKDKVENFNKFNKVGDLVEVSFNISSREHNQKWYSQIDAWKVFKAKAETVETVDEADDLPF